MDDFERRVQAEINRLVGPEFSTSRPARRMRNATIRALAQTSVAGEPWTGEHGVLGPKRPATIVSENNFYGKKHWYQHPLVREVIENVEAIYQEREDLEAEQARQGKKSWLVNKEFEAAHQQFDKATELLKLPHIIKKTKQGKDGEGTTIILDPANAAVFNAAVNLNMKASDLARRSLGLPADVTRSEVTGAEGGPLRTQEVGRVHGGAEHVAAVTRILVEAGAIELRSAEPGSDAETDEVHSA